MLDAISLSEEELGLLFAPAPSSIKHATSKQRNSKKAPSAMTSKSFPTATGAVVPARCGYRTGKCQNLQAIKRNGKLHKLCEFHRERANLNQKKLDRKKRMQRSKRSAASSSCESVTSEDDADSVDMDNRSPRAVEAMTINSVFVKSEPITEIKTEPDTELVLPTSLHEAPLVLSCEELAIFCSLMTFDMNHRGPAGSCHYYTSAV
ncbi:hypothetical protein PF005_g26912 [Phytophthora fragariae]|uniref:WRC domain-containing protein n=2 Tax=Phytophthora TaxID=4783 RepID=A0A6A4BL23_9STRA|nr:hypothetical protein PF009_g27555 [Phytophthora fragariae]KAE9011377.1 hypothetical protein PR002_g15101 [Phytophthora rubi]KAE8971947.1 hypothetical protein PF011_g25841 [Phytophthora fragariae]KAE9016922.1 hypothetical protein PR001_g14532 [Phytophthora rubi]KAE9070095.1 hypothetical protein PF010_g26420 [Phytophthora fragariae]